MCAISRVVEFVPPADSIFSFFSELLAVPCFMWMWKPMIRSLDVYDIYRFDLLTLRSKDKSVQINVKYNK